MQTHGARKNDKLSATLSKKIKENPEQNKVEEKQFLWKYQVHTEHLFIWTIVFSDTSELLHWTLGKYPLKFLCA